MPTSETTQTTKVSRVWEMVRGGQDQREAAASWMDPLAKTGPISGAVGARRLGRRLAAVCGFGSSLSVREEERSVSEAWWHT